MIAIAHTLLLLIAIAHCYVDRLERLEINVLNIRRLQVNNNTMLRDVCVMY